jgi:tRNA G10  N-methylase Trm11
MYYSSIVNSDTEALQAIINLHIPSKQIDADITYSKGNFYKKEISSPKYKYDLYPQTQDTMKADARSIPLPDSVLTSVVFDPPFLATTGKSLLLKNTSNKINKRFSVFPSEKELHLFYREAMKEVHRVLKEGGILIFKCQDKVSSGKNYLSHVFIIEEAQKIGFYVKDLLILIAKQRIVANWQKINQKHVRKYHSYYLVMEKSNKKIKYIE